MEVEEYEADRDQAIWNDGKKAGIKEVVKSVAPIMETFSDPIFRRNWERKLKEWGIE